MWVINVAVVELKYDPVGNYIHRAIHIISQMRKIPIFTIEVEDMDAKMTVIPECKSLKGCRGRIYIRQEKLVVNGEMKNATIIYRVFVDKETAAEIMRTIDKIMRLHRIIKPIIELLPAEDYEQWRWMEIVVNGYGFKVRA